MAKSITEWLDDYDVLLGDKPKQATPVQESKSVRARRPLNENRSRKLDEDQLGEAIDSVVEEAIEMYKTIPHLIEEGYTRSDLSKLASLVKQHIESRVASGMSLSEATADVKGLLQEKTRAVKVGGHYVQKKTKKTPRKLLLKAKIYRKRNHAKLAKNQEKKEKTHQFKVDANKLAAFHAKHESTHSSGLNALLESSSAVIRGTPASDLHEALAEAFSSLRQGAELCRFFFENYAVGDHKDLVTTSTKLIEHASAKATLMESAGAKADLDSLLNQVRVYQGLLKAVDEYKVLQAVGN